MALTCLWIVLLPLIAFAIQLFCGKRLPRQGDWVSLLAIFFSFVLATRIFMALLASGSVSDSLSFPWIFLPGASPVRIPAGILVNNLTIILLFMVTLCALVIHIFSIGYMRGQPRYHLFFAYLSLFSAAMLGLVVSDSLFGFFMFWEVMGLCSYLLIGFYQQRPAAAAASFKAFMTTRIGDVCFFIGVMSIYSVFHTTSFTEVYEALRNPSVQSASLFGLPALTAIGFLLMMGTIGKSAQFPLHVWLPDAMEGPTPVSALIHAATMVAAGVFLLIRMFPLLQAEGGSVLVTIAYVGAVTSFLASLLAVIQTDIKKVLAYSTISQLGLMVLAVGVGAFGAAVLHLITHAFFKACLFLGSGSVIHAANTQDMREMGGLRKKMPVTFACMLVATLAISGVPLFSGFVSKDRILAGVLAYSIEYPTHWLLPALGFSTVAITAFYMFRLIYMTFAGAPRDAEKFEQAHESPSVMLFPLVILAVFSLSIWFGGWWQTAMGSARNQMGMGVQESTHDTHSAGIALSLLLLSLGLGLSTLMYQQGRLSAERVKRALLPLYGLLSRKYFFDELYLGVFLRGGVLRASRWLAFFDDKFIDRVLVDGWRDLTLFVKSAVGKFDDIVVDRILVDGTGDVIALGGRFFRLFQTGRVQQYLVFSLVALGLAFFCLVRGGWSQ